jgi:hypothetical protein
LFGLGLFEVLDRKLQLLDQQLAALGGLTELFAPRLGQHQLQPLDLQPADSDFALRQGELLALRKDHRMRGGKIGGKWFGGRRHEDDSNHIRCKKSRRISILSQKATASAGRLWTPGFPRHSPVDARQQVGELRNTDRDHTVRQRRPQKAAALQPLREQACALAIMPNDFDQIAAAAPKNIEIASMRIAIQILLNKPREARESPPHVGMTRRKPHPDIAGNRNHRRSSTSRTRASASGSTCASTRIRRRLQSSISISPFRAVDNGRIRR